MDTKAISEALGVFPIWQGERATYYLVNRNTGVQLRLEINTQTGWLRMHVDLRRKSPGRHIAAIEFDLVEKTRIEAQDGLVYFSDERTTLSVQANGTFRIDVE